jgi:hypothetical protein
MFARLHAILVPLPQNGTTSKLLMVKAFPDMLVYSNRPSSQAVHAP